MKSLTFHVTHGQGQVPQVGSYLITVSLLSGIKRSMPEWGRSKLSNGHRPPHVHLKVYFCLNLAEGHNKCSFQRLIIMRFFWDVSFECRSVGVLLCEGLKNTAKTYISDIISCSSLTNLMSRNPRIWQRFCHMVSLLIMMSFLTDSLVGIWFYMNVNACHSVSMAQMVKAFNQATVNQDAGFDSPSGHNFPLLTLNVKNMFHFQ